MSIEIIVKNEQETDVLGRVLAHAFPCGTVVALIGTLGVGKTRLVQAVSQALGVPRDEVGSPTFVLIREYKGETRNIYHFDAYRLKDSDEFLELGVDEYFDSEGISFVEWAERVADVIPEDHVEISIFPIEETSRRFVVSARGNFDSSFEKLVLERWSRASKPRLK